MNPSQPMPATAGQPAPVSSASADTGARRRGGMPAFFDHAPTLTVRDPLAEFLGAAEGGLIEYRYADAVRLAGHSCPTVAGAYLMTLHGLRALYGAELPERGGVQVFLHEAPDSGTTGVVAAVAQLLTGAARETGFQGIGPAGVFSRQHLLSFGADMDGALGLRRRDSGRAVQVRLEAGAVPWPEEMRALLPRVMVGRTSADDELRFGVLWQERVRRMLIEHADDPALIQVSDWDGAP